MALTHIPKTGVESALEDPEVIQATGISLENRKRSACVGAWHLQFLIHDSEGAPRFTGPWFSKHVIICFRAPVFVGFSTSRFCPFEEEIVGLCGRERPRVTGRDPVVAALVARAGVPVDAVVDRLQAVAGPVVVFVAAIGTVQRTGEASPTVRVVPMLKLFRARMMIVRSGGRTLRSTADTATS